MTIIGKANSLIGSCYQGVGGSGDESGAVVLSCDGNGNYNVLAEDDAAAGTITQGQLDQGTYMVGANGSANVSGEGNVPAGFLISRNKGFIVSVGSKRDFCRLEPRTGVAFSNASIAGSYAGGPLAPLDYTNGRNEVDVISADGLGTITASGDSSKSEGLSQNLGNIVNYSIASNGRGIGQGQGDGAPGVIYVISPSSWLVLQPKQDADVDVVEHRAFPTHRLEKHGRCLSMPAISLVVT